VWSSVEVQLNMFNRVRTDDKLTSLITSASQYLRKAVNARELFYRGMDEAAERALLERQPNMGPEDAKYSFGKSQRGTQLIADNKWHMAQSRTFALMSIARGVFLLVKEQQRTNLLLEQIKDKK
jgi:hypothetical protein